MDPKDSVIMRLTCIFRISDESTETTKSYLKFNAVELIYNNVICLKSGKWAQYNEIYYTGTQLLIVIIDATWNVNACHYEVSYASASSLRMRRSTSSVLGR